MMPRIICALRCQLRTGYGGARLAGDATHVDNPVIPAKAGIHFNTVMMVESWIPAFAGMTVK
jgi:hypothetical protein